MADALVIGAGPAGLIAARTIAEHSFSVTVFEEHEQVGVPNHCAGLLSIEGLQRLGVEPDSSYIQHTILGGRVYSPDGTCIEIKDNKPRAYVVDRARLDHLLANKAENAGAKLCMGTRVKSINIEKRNVIGITTTERCVNGRITIDAEGPSRRLLKAINLVNDKNDPLIGINVEAEVEIDSGMVELWFNNEYAKGLFAWVIPTGERSARIGLATRDKDVQSNLEKFIRHRFGDIKHGKIHTGLVLTDGPLKRISYGGLLLVGDSAGHVKPTTGGGVIMGGLCSIQAGLTTVKALEDNDFSESSVMRYDTICKRKYEAEFTSMLKIRRLMNNLSNNSINLAFHAVKEENLDSILTDLIQYGDMDLQGEVIKRALLNPRVVALLLKVVGRYALSELIDLVNI
ncbi:MAG: NAD(P)/FAD-dependent oxidoreductase [Candidatus Bathyarchaeota archaeon]|nr:NAD(P)/FAD-dependent oxidoreductase [Candidatus Bathyarchaeota archaeon]